MGDPSIYKPWIWRRLLVLSLLCALLPLAATAVFLIATASGGSLLGADVSEQVADFTEDQYRLSIDAHAQRIDARLGQIAHRVRLLSSYAQEILSAPEVYSAFAGYTSMDDETGAGVDSGADAGEIPDEAATPLGNPLFYVKGDDGAYRKVIDDGKPVVFFRVPEDGGGFSPLDIRRLYATAALDQLLKESVFTDRLTSQAFIVTKDNLLRTYPYLDFSLWHADKSLTNTTLYAWSPAKADQMGLVWTRPYQSHMTNEWVVACLGSVQVGGQQAAVVGIELALAGLPDELLSFSLGSGGVCWLDRRFPGGTDNEASPSGGVAPSTTGNLDVVLVAQARGEEILGVKPVAAADLPTEKHHAGLIIDEATIQLSGKQEVADVLNRLAADHPETMALGTHDGCRYLVSAPVEVAGWMLCGIVECPALTTVRQYTSGVESNLALRLTIVLGVLFFSLVLAFGLAWFEARRLVHPITILTQQVRQTTASRMTSSVAIADEGEIGALACAVQELVDIASSKQTQNNTGKGDA